MCVTAVPWIMCRQNTTPCHYTSHFVQWFKIFASPVYWMSACMTACSRSLLSASPSKAFLRRVLHSIVILSFSLTSSPPPYILIFSLVTFPLCQLPSLCTFPAFLSVPARPAPRLFYSSPKISSFFPAITYSIPFSFSFFSPHSASCLRARFPHAFIVYSCCFPTCSPPFPSSFLPSHTFLSVQRVISSLLLHINPSSEWATWICLWPRSFCSSGTLENQERAYHLISTHECMWGLCNQTWNDMAASFCMFAPQVHFTWLCLFCVCLWKPVCWRWWVCVWVSVWEHLPYSMFISMPSREP